MELTTNLHNEDECIKFFLWDVLCSMDGLRGRGKERRMNQVLEQIQKIGIVPVVVLNDAEDAEPLAEALIDGGIACAEVTFRTDAAEESIRRISAKYPDMLVGAGTVLTTEQVDRAVEAGAKFIVSPGFNPKVVSCCVEKGIPVTPGTSGPSDVEAAIEMGLEVVKFFPAEASGGLKFLKAIAGPYTKMKFMPTGGINAENLKEYLAFDKILACGGSWMVKGDLIKAGNFAEITRLTKEAVLSMLGFELAHIGINCENESEADNVSAQYASLFGFGQKEGNSSFFAGDVVEATKTPFRGEKGHLAIRTNSIDRALYYLAQQGVNAVMETAKYKNEKLVSVYIDREIGGFALHLLQK